MKLGNSRNQCGACREYFNSNHAFEKHRTGIFGVDRRCLNAQEMLDKKMLKNSAEYWVGSIMDKSLIEKRNALRK
jgi:hypothetical protein